MDKHVQESKNLCNTFDATENDSILDFKSPEKFTKVKLNEFSNPNVHSEKKTVIKSKKFVRNQKEVRNKQCLEGKKTLQESQPSIESSFFKSKNSDNDKNFTTDAKVALVCPLCFKIFKDLNSRALHMKICAFKHNIPTKKLLDAIELQKRQEDERKSLGLLAAPIVQDKKKSIPSRKMNSCEETDLQLALALSKSLQEAEELDKINEFEGLPRVSNQFTSEVNESTCGGQLEKFGFVNTKPPLFVRNKKRKRYEITVLQTRSQEERNRILTERISEILMGNEPITQNQKEVMKYTHMIEKKTNLRSRLLQELCNKEETLWDRAKLTPKQKRFYVSNLSEHITSQDIQIEEETVLQFENISNRELIQYEKKVCGIEKLQEASCTELYFIDEKCENCKNMQFISTVTANWSNALNDSSASDIIIFVKNDKHIWAHKLVFFIQCSNILLDVTPNDTSLFIQIKEKICWADVPYNIALAFLEFVYCGIIKRYFKVLQNLTNFSLLRNLARKYKVKELFGFLQMKESEMKQAKCQIDSEDKEEEVVSEKTDSLKLSDHTVGNLFNSSTDLKLNSDEKLDENHLRGCIMDKSVFVDINFSKNICTEQLREKVNDVSEITVLRNFNVSPDLFDDGNDTMQSEGMKSNRKHVKDSIGIEKTKNENDSTPEHTLNQITPHTATFSGPLNIISFKDVEENVNLLSNIPHLSTPNRGDRSNIKLKSNLSIFIEQFKKENARSESDTDSEVSILSVCPKLPRNPFNIKQRDSSNFGTNTVVKETFEEKRDGLSIFDNITDSKLDVKTSSYEKDDTNININTESLNNVLELSESSIEEYIRNYDDWSLNKSITDIDQNIKDKVINSACRNSLKENVEELQNSQDENGVDIFSDFNLNEDEISMYSKYKKRHENNSIVKYRSFVQKHVLTNSERDDTKYDKSRKENNTDSNTLSLSDTEKHSFEESKRASEQNLCVLSDERETNKNQCSFINITSSLNTQSNIPKIGRMDDSNKSENGINLQSISKTSFALKKPNTSKSNIMESPVLVFSSPELDCDTSDVNKCAENKTNKSVLNFKQSEYNSHIFETDIYLANVHIDDDNSNVSLHTKEIDLTDNKVIPIVTTSKNTELIATKNSFAEEFKSNEKSLIINESNRKFRRKSRSETSLHINTKGITNNNSRYRRSNGNDSKVTASPEIVRDNITPPPDYDNMKTPELHVELNKYGLKIQKRKRAIKLLTYIYNELHPVCVSENADSELAIINSENDEPPCKRANHRRNDIETIFSQENIDTQLAVNIIDEEKQFNEPEFTPISDSVTDIKEVFLKLLTVEKELHNKILAYEPLCINSLHSMLKTEGFKCKMNTLMDFLDEQCITFYIQETKQKKDKSISA